MDQAKLGTVAVHKLARLICTKLTRDGEGPDQGQDYFEKRQGGRVRSTSRNAPKKWA